MNRLLGWLYAWRAWVHFERAYRGHRGVLSVVDDGLELRQYKLHGSMISLDVCWRIAWRDVTKVVAFKRDCYTVDLICFAFVLEGTKLVEVDEEMEGWRALIEALAARFGIKQEDWFLKVATPAFATNATTLWPPQSGDDPLPDRAAETV